MKKQNRLVALAVLCAGLASGVAAASGAPEPPGGMGYVIERIEVRGNDKTRPEVILRSLEMREGDILTTEGIRKSREALYRTRLFRTVHLASKPGSEQGKAVIMVYVLEKRFGDVGVSLEYSELDGFGLAADAYHVNLGGQGRVIGMEYGLGERFKHWGLSYNHPWLSSNSGLSLHLRVSGSLADRDIYRVPDPQARGSYDLERLSGTFGIGRQVGVAHRMILSYTFEEVDVGNIQTPSDPSEGTAFPAEVGAAVGRDPVAYVSLDLHTRPGNETWASEPGVVAGIRADFSAEVLGSSADYIRVRTELRRNIQTLPSQILSIGGRAGLILGDPLFHERFYLDGPNQLRAFERRAIGPEGGEEFLSAEGVYSIPIGGLGRTYIFAEAAGIWRNAAGVARNDKGATVGVGVLLFNRVDISFGLGTGVLIVKSHRFGGINVGL